MHENGKADVDMLITSASALFLITTGITSIPVHAANNYRAEFYVHRIPVQLKDADRECRQNGHGQLAHLRGFDAANRAAPGSQQLLAAIEAVEKFGIQRVWIGSIGDRAAPVLDTIPMPFVLDVTADTVRNGVTLPGRLVAVETDQAEYSALCQFVGSSYHHQRGVGHNDLQASRRFRPEQPQMPFFPPPPHYYYGYPFVQPMMYGPMMQAPQFPFEPAYPAPQHYAAPPPLQPPMAPSPLKARIARKLGQIISAKHTYQSFYGSVAVDEDDACYEFTFGKRKGPPKEMRKKTKWVECSEDELPRRADADVNLLHHGMSVKHTLAAQGSESEQPENRGPSQGRPFAYL